MRSLIALTTVLLAAAAPAQSAYPPPRGRPAIDIVSYEFTLDLPDSGASIEARAVVMLRRLRAADSLWLDLVALRVDSVLVNGRPTAITRDTARIGVPLPAWRGRGDVVTVVVRYGGPVTDGLIIRTDSLGHWSAFGDNWPQRARFWLPTVDAPGDKATVTWIVRAPSDRRVIANGALVEETPLAGPRPDGRAARTLTRWRETRPIPVYTMVIAAGPLVSIALDSVPCARMERAGCVQQSVYVFPEDRAFLPGPFARSPDIVDFFTRTVGPFPYEKLAHLESSTRFGGMENSSAIFYADRPFRQRTMGPGVIAHETAHQWFGDAVTEASWAHLWLSEGFASYFEQLWWQHASGDSAFRRGMGELRRQIIESPVTAARPVIDSAETNYLALLNSNSYQKGAWTLHMLRSMLGDRAFFRGIRAYYARFRHSTAVTDDLMREMERASGRGRKLGWFFDQWLRRPGVAMLSTRWRYDQGARRVVLDVEQGGGFAPYRFPLVVALTERSGVVRRTTVDVRAARLQSITLPLALTGAPQSVALDPDVQLLASFTAH
ncbi:MAG: M1 family metallopeptidase [Gemmatimonadota bacterium]|nr:M1 family metallopeptidase [Gemmatimonadota bacterium]